MNTFYENRHIVVTGGFGFIGQNLIRLLNLKGVAPYVIDKLPSPADSTLVFHRIDEIPYGGLPCTIVHLAANVDTTARMTPELWDTNVDLTLRLLERQREYCGPIPRFIYASSGAIYGLEEHNFTERITDIQPVNPYAYTKLMLDVLLAGKPNVYGLRFFNVYGSGESHKGSMRSLVSRAVESKDTFSIFRTGRPDIKDGDQARDFVHVEDVCKVIWHFITTEDNRGGLFNVGSGKATSFNEIAQILNLRPEYTDMPVSLRGQYQFHTKANLTKLRAAGYAEEFLTVEQGIQKMRI